MKKKTPIPKLIKKAEKVFNAWIRKRDAGRPCISCGSEKIAHAGHYYSAGSYPSLRFDEDNVHGQGVGCNLFKHGNLIHYRHGLVKKYGEDFVRVLDIKAVAYKRDGWKWERDYLEGVISKYSKPTHQCPHCGVVVEEEHRACERCCVRGTNTGHSFKLD